MVRFVFLFVFLYPGILLSQKDDILIHINGHEISKTEFERIYNKNNRNLMDESLVKAPKEYLDMYINFKLKVLEAKQFGMDTIQSYKTELAGYRRELAAPYLTDMKYDEEMVKELYTRMTKEINASHILLIVDPEKGTEHELEVLKKIHQVRTEIKNGKDFHDAALEYSEDPSVQSNKGNLGYFSAFQMVTPFENQAFNTPVGEVSEPVRTSFGFHLINIHDLRENQGEIKVAHIIKIFPRDEPYNEFTLKAEVDSVYNLLVSGADFADIAAKWSDDKRSAGQGGEMSWFSANQMIPEFSEPAFALKQPGDVSQPFKSQFGYHIIKKIDQRPIPSFEESRARIEANIKKDPDRSSSTRKVFVEKLQNEYGFSELEENYDLIKNLSVSDNAIPNNLLFTIDNKNYFLQDFRNYLQIQIIGSGSYSDYYEKWKEYEIIHNEDSKLEEKHPEFRYLMQEYREGLLFFNIMEEKIWKFAAEDSAGLEQFYQKNPNLFQWEERFKGFLVTCKNEMACQEAEKYFDALLPAIEVEDLLNHEEKLIEIREGAWEEGQDPIVDYYIWSAPEPAGFLTKLTFVRGNIIPSEPKKLEEAKGLYVSAYQEFLEKKWLQDLRKKYNIKVNRKLLKKIPHV